jgi:hypothetical protein
MSEAILDWDRTFNKNVRSIDMQDAENVAAVDINSIIIICQKVQNISIKSQIIHNRI